LLKRLYADNAITLRDNTKSAPMAGSNPGSGIG